MERDTMPEIVDSEESAKTLIRWCARNIGLGYHPDTLFEDYVQTRDGARVFASEVAELLNELHDRAFQLLGDSVYDVGMDALQEEFPELWNEGLP